MLHDAQARNQAKAFALEKHAGQTDKLGVPYGAHIAHVAAQLERFGPEYEMTGWLHDVVEDCDVTLDEIEEKFGVIIRRGVDAMTKRKGEAYFGEYLERIEENRIAIMVKFADSRHNLAKTHLLQNADDQNRLKTKYESVLRRLQNKQWSLARWGDLGDIHFDGTAWTTSAPAGAQ